MCTPGALASILYKSKQLSKAVAMENPSIVAIMLEAELDYVDQVFLKFPTLSRRILVYN